MQIWASIWGSPAKGFILTPTSGALITTESWSAAKGFHDWLGGTDQGPGLARGLWEPQSRNGNKKICLWPLPGTPQHLAPAITCCSEISMRGRCIWEKGLPCVFWPWASGRTHQHLELGTNRAQPMKGLEPAPAISPNFSPKRWNSAKYIHYTD